MTVPNKLCSCTLGVLLSIVALGCGCRATPSKPASMPVLTEPATERDFEITLLVTADEHGWMEPHLFANDTRYEGGMANLLGYWRGAYDYQPEEFVTLSTGDSWTGPYESTALRGMPVVDIMNIMGYDAQVIGNHDFDFGLGTLRERASQARYPLLGANLYREGSQARPAFVIGSTTVRTGSARVGVVGLCNVDTPVLTHPRNVQGLVFTEYEGALRREIAAQRSTGADVVVALIHQEVNSILPLAPLLRDLGVHFAGSGHSHAPSLTVDRGIQEGPEDDILFCNPGPYARSFCHIRLRFAGNPLRLVQHDGEIVRIRGERDRPLYPPAAEVEQVIAEAKSRASLVGNEVLVRSERGLLRKGPSQLLGRVIVDSWLDALPYVQVAITNAGGIRQNIDPGEVTMGTLVGVLPFDNYLLVVDLNGSQLKEALGHPQSIAGGLRYSFRCAPDGTREVTEAYDLKGNPIVDDRTYKVVVNEFIYRGGDRYRLQEFDPTPEETAVHWRDPVAAHMRRLKASGKTLDPEDDKRIDGSGATDRCGPRTY